MKKRVLISTLVVAAGLSTWGIAQAQDSDKNLGNDGRVTAKVSGTPAGMPPTAQVMFSVTNAAGTRIRGFPTGAAYTSERLAVGTYELTFANRNITSCAYLGTIGLSGNSGSSPPGFITVVGRAGTNNALFIQTFNSSAALADLGFHLTVNC